MTTRTFTIDDMTCTSCVMHIEELEDTLPGVRKIAVNFKKHRMTAEFDEAQVDSQTIADAVTKLGYPTMPTSDEPKKGFLSWKR
jgi:copper chaperone CopZ